MITKPKEPKRTEGTVFGSHGSGGGCAKSGSEPTRLSSQLAVRNRGSRDSLDAFEGIGTRRISSELRGATVALPLNLTDVPLASRPVRHQEPRSRLVARPPSKHPAPRRNLAPPSPAGWGPCAGECRTVQIPHSLTDFFHQVVHFPHFAPSHNAPGPLTIERRQGIARTRWAPPRVGREWGRHPRLGP